jgi:glutamate-ammonia-ligase adenylyltransferase
LGKFGGRELGYGSDIEMVTIYQDEGTTDGASPIENSRYFGDFVRGCLGILSTQREGIFEIDLRLRPYGNAGPLASSLDGFRQYYSADGNARQFERLALVKLRPVAGDSVLGQLVRDARDAYAYSGRPLDLDNVRHLRHRQATELVPAGEVSAKHSPGGLVDVEYFVQACQVTAGYSDPSVRLSNTLQAINRLTRGGHLPAKLASDLIETYGFLRRLIDALRVVRGHAKDLTIPDQDSREFAYLARRLQFDSPDQLSKAIPAHMDFAKGLWDRGILPAK